MDSRAHWPEAPAAPTRERRRGRGHARERHRHPGAQLEARSCGRAERRPAATKHTQGLGLGEPRRARAGEVKDSGSNGADDGSGPTPPARHHVTRPTALPGSGAGDGTAAPKHTATRPAGNHKSPGPGRQGFGQDRGQERVRQNATRTTPRLPPNGPGTGSRRPSAQNRARSQPQGARAGPVKDSDGTWAGSGSGTTPLAPPRVHRRMTQSRRAAGGRRRPKLFRSKFPRAATTGLRAPTRCIPIHVAGQVPGAYDFSIERDCGRGRAAGTIQVGPRSTNATKFLVMEAWLWTSFRTRPPAAENWKRTESRRRHGAPRQDTTTAMSIALLPATRRKSGDPGTRMVGAGTAIRGYQGRATVAQPPRPSTRIDRERRCLASHTQRHIPGGEPAGPGVSSEKERKGRTLGGSPKPGGGRRPKRKGWTDSRKKFAAWFTPTHPPSGTPSG